jgi:HD superfamily phosphohydrolase
VARAVAYAVVRLPTVPLDATLAAAWLHDIGHSPHLARTGFHPLDGAMYLREGDWDDVIVRLVAHHSHSAVAAESVGATYALSHFEPVSGLAADVLAFADVVAGVDGKGIGARDHLEGHADAQRMDEDAFRRRRVLLERSVRTVQQALIVPLSPGGVANPRM